MAGRNGGWLRERVYGVVMEMVIAALSDRSLSFGKDQKQQAGMIAADAVVLALSGQPKAKRKRERKNGGKRWARH